MIKHIVALSLDSAIGAENKLPWHIPEDLKRFKELTMDQTIYMGFNTFESILPYSKNGQFLPGRKVMVISSTHEKAVERFKEYEQKFLNVGFTYVDEMTDYINSTPNEEHIIVGGTILYSEYAPDVIEATLINIVVDNADAFYPHSFVDYKLVSKTAIKLVDGQPGYSFCKFVKV